VVARCACLHFGSIEVGVEAEEATSGNSSVDGNADNNVNQCQPMVIYFSPRNGK
jgi:hypothetical protein